MDHNEHHIQCNSNHEEIMAEFKRINKRLDADWKIIKAGEDDRIGRTYIWNVVKWIGFAGGIMLLTKLFE